MREFIRDVPDFPKSGILFKDIFPLLQNCFTEIIDDLSRKIERPAEIDYIAGIESRGFIFASALAYKLNKGFVPIRKGGKLPPPKLSSKISLEYGEAEIEMAEGLGKIIIVDDVLATGGTIQGAWSLAKQCGYTPTQAIVLINIVYLNNKNLSKLPIKSLFDFRED